MVQIRNDNVLIGVRAKKFIKDAPIDKVREVNTTFEKHGTRAPYSDSARPKTITLNNQRRKWGQGELNDFLAWVELAKEEAQE